MNGNEIGNYEEKDWYSVCIAKGKEIAKVNFLWFYLFI